MIPGFETPEVVVRKPAWSTKTNPEGFPEAVSSVLTGTSEEFKTFAPTTKLPKFDAA